MGLILGLFCVLYGLAMLLVPALRERNSKRPKRFGRVTEPNSPEFDSTRLYVRSFVWIIAGGFIIYAA